MQILETPRLVLRRLTLDDDGFIVELLNDPAFVRYIGDKGVRTRADARQYLTSGPIESYARFGFGLYLVALKETDEPIGMCGLLKRDVFEDVDVGFAFLPQFRSKGYAFESASAVIAHARETFGFGRILAITSPDNAASMALLERLGFAFEKTTRLPGEGSDVRLFASDPVPRLMRGGAARG